MPTYKIPVTMTVCGTIEVKGRTLQEAEAKVTSQMLPREDREYADGTLEIDTDHPDYGEEVE